MEKDAKHIVSLIFSAGQWKRKRNPFWVEKNHPVFPFSSSSRSPSADFIVFLKEILNGVFLIANANHGTVRLPLAHLPFLFVCFTYIGNDENFIKARPLVSQRKTAINVVRKLVVNLTDCSNLIWKPQRGNKHGKSSCHFTCYFSNYNAIIV